MFNVHVSVGPRVTETGAGFFAPLERRGITRAPNPAELDRSCRLA